ncbi:hypothetical protein EVI01_22930 [Enterococcus villorum]|uniref:Uncharacterized protein n=1 Tax=Enterococcus villorum TaxID=112904 RepID=A0A511J4M6_9ENTE|nr:hypothetical protein EVI01_22930 [Enterococcus villorum]
MIFGPKIIKISILIELDFLKLSFINKFRELLLEQMTASLL